MSVSVTSVGGIPIRLTDERWAHIVEAHHELAGMREEVVEAVDEPDRGLAGAGAKCWRSKHEASVVRL